MKQLYVSIMLVMALLLSGGCSVNEPQSDTPTTATFAISTRAGLDSNATDNELINTWRVVFVDNAGIVKLILNRPTENTGAVEREEFKFNLPAGKYTAYAFANITPEKLPVFTVNQTMPDLTSVVWRDLTGDYVPMSGFKQIELAEGVTNRVSIEVVRLWAKLCFEFTTDSDETVTISKISMTPANNDKVKLLPNYTTLDGMPNTTNGRPDLIEATECSTLERILSEALTLSKDNPKTETFYLLESSAEGHPTGHYPIDLEVKYGEGEMQTVSALAWQLDHINRNDFITIPVLLTNWLVDIEVLFYPPIGGYPAVLTEKKDNEFYAKFGSGGKFVIRPTVTTASGEKVPDSNLTFTLSTEDASGILSQDPSEDTTTHEITGVLADVNSGTAIVTLIIEITNDQLKHQIMRKLYIIRN